MLLQHALILTGVSFSLHLAWEYAQCSSFFVHGTLPAGNSTMLFATLGDVALTWILYFALALWTRTWLWSLRRWNRSEVILLEVLALVVGVFIEARALSTGRWSYTSSNPRLPGTPFSLLPLLQMMALTPLNFWIVRRVLGHRS